MDEIAYGRFIDPFTDFGFKRIFGSESNKDILIDFLNELFAGEREVIDLTYSNNENGGQLAAYRRAIFDLSCTGSNGEQFIIEVQRVKQDHFRDRCFFYAASLVRDQVVTGNWNYELKPVYLIGLMDFCFEDSLPGSYLHHIHLTKRESGLVFYEKFGLIFIEMPGFGKTALELDTELDKWLYLLKNLGNLDQVPEFLAKPVFSKLFQVAEVCNLNQQEKMAYDASLKARWDYYNSLDYALKEGVEKGRRDEQLSIARSMKDKGMDVLLIAELLGMTAGEVEAA
nr:Rpn family recombination-promoting nuclease/putative transposase [uncultured Dyadobacter sp.]